MHVEYVGYIRVMSSTRIRELNVVYKNPSKVDVRVAIVFPSTYQASLSSLGLNLLYYMLNSYEYVYAERFTFDTGIRSIETASPLKDFDVILVSLSYELMYPYFLKMLHNASIPLFSKNRMNSKHPLIIAGGPAISGNPEPLSEFVDVFVIGDAEPTIPLLLEKILEYSDDKRKLLESLPSSRGFYTPIHREEVIKAQVSNIDNTFHPIKQIQSLTVEPVYGKGFMVEVSRGCSRRCRFCLEGHVMGLRRDRSLSVIKKLINKGLEANKVNRVIFYSLSFFDHPEADKILEYVVDEIGVEASIPSLRPDTLNKDRIELIVRAKQKTLTIAPETLSPHIASFLGKGFTKEFIEDIAKTAIEKGLKIKMYYIIGVPGETIEDIKKIPETVKEILRDVKVHRSEVIKLSVNPLIPKPQTPLQGMPMEKPESIQWKLKLIDRELPKPKAVLDYYPPKWAVVQAALALADRSIAKTLALWSLTDIGLGSWRRVLRETGYKLDSLFRYREPPYPWSFIKISW